MAYLKYRLAKNRLLRKRDNYIAKRIDETLTQGEVGILFLGAYHNIIPKLAKDIRLIEVKEVEKIRGYQKSLLSFRKNKEEFARLAKYLVSAVESGL